MSANSFESPDSTPATATQLPQSPPVQGDKLSDLQTPRLADASLPSSTAAIGTASADNADNADDHSPVMPQEPKCAEPPMSPPPNRIDDMVKELQQIEVFHDEHKRPYASVLLGGHVEHLEIGSETFTQHLDAVAYRKWKRGLMKHQHDEVVSVLRAKAIHEGPTHPVHLRVAPGDSSLYIDLVDKDRWSVEVTAQGWTLTQTPPVRFCRPPMMAALPTPMRGGQINDLRPFLNCTDGGFKMIVGFILASFRAKGPYPILELVGEKGTSKSTTTRLVQALIDPSQGHLGSPISSEEQLAMRAKHSWLVTLDNCSGATDSLSDMLCRLATGGAFTKRELYTNTTQITMDYCRPCVINGIENIAKRADLLDRCWGWEWPGTVRGHDRAGGIGVSAPSPPSQCTRAVFGRGQADHAARCVVARLLCGEQGEGADWRAHPASHESLEQVKWLGGRDSNPASPVSVTS